MLERLFLQLCLGAFLKLAFFRNEYLIPKIQTNSTVLPPPLSPWFLMLPLSKNLLCRVLWQIAGQHFTMAAANIMPTNNAKIWKQTVAVGVAYC